MNFIKETIKLFIPVIIMNITDVLQDPLIFILALIAWIIQLIDYLVDGIFGDFK